MLVQLMALILAVGFVGCDGDGGPAGSGPKPDEIPQGIDGLNLKLYEDDRLSFVYPEEWQLQVSEDDEQRVRVEKRTPEAAYAQAAIGATWPVLHQNDLETTIDFFGRSPDEPEISAFEQRPVKVLGAEEAVLQTFITTDAIVGEELRTEFWTVFALTETGRTMFLSIGVLENSDIDAQSLAETVISSLRLKTSWGS